MLLGGAGAKIVNFVFPAGCLGISYYLYFRHPILYNGFVWWLFFITPFLRRICDWRIGAFTQPSSSYILLSPFLASLVCLHTLYVNLPKTRENGSTPFVIAIAAIFYGYLIGIIYGKPVSTTVELLDWLPQVAFGYHLYVNWRRYPLHMQNIKRVFMWGILIMGVYGIYQYIVAPEWDRLWLVESGMISSAGSPYPFGMRVWSTMNSQGPYADYAVTGLLILLACQSWLVIPASIAGALSLLLSLVRAGWITLMAGVLVLLTSLSAKQKFRIFMGIVCMTLVLIPLVTMEPFAKSVTARLETMTNLQEDGSAKARQGTYAILFDTAVSQIVGKGIGSFDTDGAPIVLLINLGWIGAIPYVGGLIFGSLLIFTTKTDARNLDFAVIRAIMVKSLLFLLTSSTMKGAQGLLLWGFLGMGMSQLKYQAYIKQQKYLKIYESAILEASQASHQSKEQAS
jgi:hypothetical protein